MVFYHKGLRVCKTPLPFVACARKAAIPHAQIWSAHESDVVGLRGNALRHLDIRCPCRWGSSVSPTCTSEERQRLRGIEEQDGPSFLEAVPQGDKQLAHRIEVVGIE